MAGTVEAWLSGLDRPAAPRSVRLRPPALALGLAAVSLAAHGLLFGLAAPLGRAPWAGGAIAAAGLIWMLWAAWTFRRAATTLRPTGLPGVLVEEGPYRFGRNPMYLGITVMLLGTALGLGTPLLTASAVAFAAIVNAVHVPHEEDRMTRRFGGWYRDYARATRRWL